MNAEPTHRVVTRKQLLYGAMGLVGVALLLGVAHHALAAADQYAVFQPSPANNEWRTGHALRMCAVEAPTGSATLTAPSGATSSLTADSEGCWSLVPGSAGAWSLSWPVAGPATRTVAFTVWGYTDDWGFWVEFAFWAFVLLGSMYKGWWFIATFAIGGSIHLINQAWQFNVQWILPLLLVGLILEWAAQKFRFRKET